MIWYGIDFVFSMHMYMVGCSEGDPKAGFKREEGLGQSATLSHDDWVEG